FYYQINIPVKDALILASCPEREVRQQWIQRIVDHDGRPGEAGGIEAWLRLGEAMGVKREDLTSQRFLLPGVRFAVDAYVSFCRFRRSSSTATDAGPCSTPSSRARCPARARESPPSSSRGGHRRAAAAPESPPAA